MNNNSNCTQSRILTFYKFNGIISLDEKIIKMKRRDTPRTSPDEPTERPQANLLEKREEAISLIQELEGGADNRDVQIWLERDLGQEKASKGTLKFVLEWLDSITDEEKEKWEEWGRRLCEHFRGPGGMNSYVVHWNGDIVFSRQHCTRRGDVKSKEEMIEKAQRLGFRIT